MFLAGLTEQRLKRGYEDASVEKGTHREVSPGRTGGKKLKKKKKK